MSTESATYLTYLTYIDVVAIMPSVVESGTYLAETANFTKLAAAFVDACKSL